MKITGIVAEYNPFHNGHAYQIKKAREVTGCDYCIAVISGDFVQRGEVAVFSKYLRTKMALLCGADLVLEIPSIFAVSSAEDFAAGAVALLDQLGVVTHLCFGSEMGESERFMETAAILADEPDSFSTKLKEGLSEGLSWPQARVRALEAEGISDLGNFLETPNNLLGVEYCKALIRQKSPIQPITILRKGNGYHSQDLTGELASASAIRREIFKEEPDFSILLSQVPDEIRSLFKAEVPLQPEDLSDLLNYRLLTLKRDGIPFSVFADGSWRWNRLKLDGRVNSELCLSGYWEDKNCFVVHARWIETCYENELKFCFEKDQVHMSRMNKVGRYMTSQPLTATAQKA